ncbi:hypothetical protein D8674_002853 [Pyrus ussuriensis x Pyrus communis]|uniref:Transmembrane protein n=1 Tax=Pyrus ussuriensis x Pyrus communis TaxID=2448454 RepID=A0A5N5FFF4_9ROSA|nr:hypothetical protein D8674_002853 [Pyrus ussuriensis x Pyrus communis]
MVHKACGIYMVPFLLLLLLSSKLIFADMIINKSLMQMEIILAREVPSIDVPISSKPPGSGEVVP